MAERTGLEPATSGVTGQHSNQLNYRSALTYPPKNLMNKKRGEYSNYDPRETLFSLIGTVSNKNCLFNNDQVLKSGPVTG
jgi:hypothetical protein